MRYRVSYLYLCRNFNGVDDIRRFADAGNQIGPVCHRHTNKRYAEYSGRLYFPRVRRRRSDRELARNNSRPRLRANCLFVYPRTLSVLGAIFLVVRTLPRCTCAHCHYRKMYIPPRDIINRCICAFLLPEANKLAILRAIFVCLT